MEYRGYTARVVFDEEAGVLFGEVEGLRDVVTFEATNVGDLKAAFRESVDDYLEMCEERGEDPEKPYSGKFLVRVDPRLHRDIAMAAARSGKSLNAFASELLRGSIGDDRGVKSSPGLAAGNTVNARIAEVWENHLANGVINALQEKPHVWNEWSRDTPSSITPARGATTPPASRTPSSNTPAKTRPKKVA